MKCINMKIIDVLLFLFNLMAVRSVSPPKDKTLQPVDNGNLNKFERDCPDLWKVIQSKNLTDWTNCQNKSETKKFPTEEEVLQFACFLAKNMMVFICDYKLNMTNEYLSLPEKNPLCPFQFSQLLELGHLAKELTNKENCMKVCSDLHENRIQCIILKKLNSYMKSHEAQISRLGLVEPNEKKSSEITTFVHKADIIENKRIRPKTSKDATNKGKMETTSNKDDTSPFGLLATDETKKPKSEKPNFDVDELEKPESERPKPTEKLKLSKTDEESKDKKNENFNSEENFMDASINPPKGEVDELSDFQGGAGEDENEKVQIFNQKEINSNDKFLQAEDSHFFFYFIMVSSIIVIGYIGFHNKNKILAYALEGTSGRRSRRRPNPARYRKLETNLEEAISSNASETVASSVVY